MRRNVGNVLKNCPKSYDKPQKNFNLSIISDFDLDSKTHSKSIYFISTLAYNTTILWITTIVYQPSFLLAPIYFFNAVVQVMLKNRNPLFSIKQIIKGNFFNHSPQIPNNLDPALYQRSHLMTFSITVLCHIIRWITLSIFPLRFYSYIRFAFDTLVPDLCLWLAPNQR